MVLEITGKLLGQSDIREQITVTTGSIQTTETTATLAGYTVAALEPNSPVEGDLWYDTTTDTLKVSTLT